MVISITHSCSEPAFLALEFVFLAAGPANEVGHRPIVGEPVETRRAAIQAEQLERDPTLGPDAGIL
jgi:hypothetical protein